MYICLVIVSNRSTSTSHHIYTRMLMRHVKRNAKIHLHSTSVFSFLVVSPYHKHDMGDSSSQFTQAGQGMASVVWRTGSQDITYTLVRIQVKSC